MAFLFNRNKPKSSLELCQSTKTLLLKLNHESQPQPRLEEDVARNLGQMKVILQGTAESEVSPQQVYQLVTLLGSEDVLLPLATSIHKLPFESRKDAQTIFSTAFRFRASPETEPLGLQHINQHRPEIVTALCNGYNHRESALTCGLILREALKHDSVAALILYDEPVEGGARPQGLKGIDPNAKRSGKGIFWKFFNWIDNELFEISADAFSTFREVLIKHKRLVSSYLITNMDLFVDKFNTILMQSSSYVTKRQSIKLLGELLLERSNYHLMTAYVESGDNLKLCMNLLKDDRRMVNYEGFHIFKIFVANPNKSVPVQRILINNRERLLKFLPTFLDDRSEDMQFTDEKAYLIRQIQQLPSTPTAPQASGMPQGAGAGTVTA